MQLLSRDETLRAFLITCVSITEDVKKKIVKAFKGLYQSHRSNKRSKNCPIDADLAINPFNVQLFFYRLRIHSMSRMS